MKSKYHVGAYRLLGTAAGGLNCNDFADELARLLTGSGIPAHITSLPADVLATPFGAAIAPMLGGVEAAMGGMAEEAAQPPPPSPRAAVARADPQCQCCERCRDPPIYTPKRHLANSATRQRTRASLGAGRVGRD